MKSYQNTFIDEINKEELGLFDKNKIKSIHADNEIEYNDYLNMDSDDLRNLTKADCINAQYFLQQYSGHLSCFLAECKTAQSLAQKELDKELAKVWKSYTGKDEYLPKEIIMANAANEHGNINDLQNHVIALNQCVNKLYGMLEQIKKMTTTLHSLSFTK
jgi:hypothetical protein